MVILKLNELGYMEKSSHSVGYSRVMIQFLSGGTMEKRESYPINEGTFKWVIANNHAEAVELMRKQIAEYISKISWLNADLNDLYFTELHSGVEGGYFWRPNGTYCAHYSVATGERI